MFRPNKRDLNLVNVRNLETIAKILNFFTLRTELQDGKSNRNLWPTNVACTRNLEMIVSACRTSDAQYLVVYLSEMHEVMQFNLTNFDKNKKIQPAPGNMTAFHEYLDNLQPQKMPISQIQSLELSKSQKRLIVFGSDTTSPESGLIIAILDTQKNLQVLRTYEVGNGISKFVKMQRIYRTNFFWGKSKNDTLICLKFHENNSEFPKVESSNEAHNNYFTVVSKVSGVLKERNIHNFAFKNNILMVTCRGENRLFILGFGVGIMKQERNLGLK